MKSLFGSAGQSVVLAKIVGHAENEKNCRGRPKRSNRLRSLLQQGQRRRRCHCCPCNSGQGSQELLRQSLSRCHTQRRYCRSRGSHPRQLRECPPPGRNRDGLEQCSSSMCTLRTSSPWHIHPA